MEQLKLFIKLTRLKKPIGYMLLFWPCAWGLTIAFDFSANKQIYIFYSVLFLTGSILMRSAGCIVNDIVDKKFDKKVFRTKNRPIASEKVSINRGAIYAMILCILAFFILIQFNNLTIFLALLSMPLAFFYPYMKRYTYWPQLFLGITFNYGLILGWTSLKGDIGLTPIILYFGAIFWTLGYDTIYGYQDIKDDEIIGLKSTSIKFKNNPKIFLTISYSVFITSLILLGLILNFNYIYYLLLIIPIMQLLFFQIFPFDKDNPIICLKIFKSNNLFGFIILINLMIGGLNL
ncbi:4-hydroxybenzoate octaprenyltransferase [Candidatus Pelagibacter bacterium]|jgi:4-hydroxybenzoate polyprenyltransferase|nr:4-hydroxybenzoate octaprenyltransferase [Candidatus Pelagibacter bacterium]